MFRRTMAGLLLGAMAACGGGGGGDGGKPVVPPTPERATLLTPTVDVTTVARNTATGLLSFRVDHATVGESLYIGMEGGRDVISGFQADPEFQDVENVSISVRDDLPAGTHATTLSLHVCKDQACAQEITGSPMSIQLRAEVLPNIEVVSSVDLARTGTDPAPSAAIPVAIPAAAGAVYLSVNESSPGVSMLLVGDTLQVTTQQLQAGTYETAGRLTSPVDARYAADVVVHYVVNPPPGGEHGMSLTPASQWLPLEQGQVKTVDYAVIRPTWTDAYTPLALQPGCDAMFSLTDLGGDTYRLTASAVDVAAGTFHSCELVVQAGNTGAAASVNSSVGVAFSVGGNYGFNIGRDTTAQQLVNTLPVTMTDGSAVTWSASTSTPWLHLAHTSGTTGVDAVQVTLDTTNLASLLPGADGHVVVSVDRANVPSQDVGVALGFLGPYLTDVWPGAIEGSSGRLYVGGYFGYGAATDGTLQVSGARVVHQQLVTDNYFVGTIPVLQVDVDQAVPGQPITASMVSPYLTTQASVPVVAAPGWAAGFAPLPYGLRKPPSFSPANAALYFAGQDTLWRFAAQGGAWTLAAAAAPGIVDVDPRPDEAHLLSVDAASQLAMRDPVTLAPVWSGVPLQEYFGQAAPVASAQDPDTKTLLHTSDGYAWITETYGQSAGVGQLVLGIVDGVAPAAGRFNDNRGFYSDYAGDGTPRTPWMTGSAGRKSVLATNDQGTRATWMLGELMSRATTTGVTFAVHPAAVSDGGDRLILANGLAMSGLGTMSTWDLSGLVPAGQQAGGWGLTGDGRFVLLYTYQLQGSGASATATQPTLHVFDLSAVTFGGALLPSETAALALAGVPGCGTPLAAGESCTHTAHVVVDPASTIAFVAGPRGVAAVPLPATVHALAVRGPGRRKAAATTHESPRVRTTVVAP